MFKPTPIDQLRQPHPDQARIDAEAARLLRDTARGRLDRIPHRPSLRPLNGPGGTGTPA
jgi:hypothetical protein